MRCSPWSPWSCSQKPIIGHAVLASINVRFTPESGHGDLRVKVPASNSKADQSHLEFLDLCAGQDFSETGSLFLDWAHSPLLPPAWSRPSRHWAQSSGRTP